MIYVAVGMVCLIAGMIVGWFLGYVYGRASGLTIGFDRAMERMNEPKYDIVEGKYK